MSRVSVFCACLVVLPNCATRAPGSAAATTAAAAASASPGLRQQRVAEDVELREIARGIFLHVTLADDANRTPANGLLVDGDAGSVLIDSGWNTAQAEHILAWASVVLHPVSDVIVTHAHRDRAGGIGAALARGLRVHALELTIEKLQSAGLAAPNVAVNSPELLRVGDRALELFFPGPGHTSDNLVVWLADARLLFLGCFGKSGQASELGNIADANLDAWSASLERVRARYPDALSVIPGHGPLAGDPVGRTLTLLASARGSRATQP